MKARNYIMGAEVSFASILEAIYEVSGLTAREVLATDRRSPIVRTRRLLWAVMRVAGWTYPAIARTSGYDWATVQHQIGRDLDKCPKDCFRPSGHSGECLPNEVVIEVLKRAREIEEMEQA
jgi:hypothetical protein